ncbi:MAG: HEAT repeat domain-containing protein [Oscillatoriaceae cyanobacterium Prado104]|jgi:hypothetical protein|nr:HEAT repeat domain-containing protein [Oscillatoriaceae cyanobacterium Prado104]
MAHYRSSLCLFACIACLDLWAPPTASGGQFARSSSIYRPVSGEIAQADFPAGSRAPQPAKTAPASDTKESQPSKTEKSNSKNPKSIANLIRILSNQRGLLLLGLAAIVVTAAAVFIMLKLVSSDESHNSQLRAKKINGNSSKHPHPATAPKSLRVSPYSFAPPKNRDAESLDRSLPLILPPGSGESDSEANQSDGIPPDPAAGETHTNGYSGMGFNILGNTNSTDLPVGKKKNSSLPPTSGRHIIDIIDSLIEDLHSPHPATRRKAIWELGQRGDSRAVEPLLDLLANSDSNQYSLILASLSEIGIRTLKPMNNAWSISLQNENAQVRKNAIRDLTRVYELVNQISHLLYRAADDPDAEVQETARWSISQLNRILPRSGRE